MIRGARRNLEHGARIPPSIGSKYEGCLPLRRAGFHTLHEGAADSLVPIPLFTQPRIGTAPDKELNVE